MNNQVLMSEERVVDFEFYQESDPRLAFIVDTEDSLKNNIFSSLIRFSSGLPPSSQLLMLDMKDERNIHEGSPEWTTQKDHGLSTIWGRDWSSRGKKLCLKCVVEEFLMKLQKVEGGKSADLIIVTPGMIQDSEEDVTAIAESLNRKGVSLRVVVYPYSRKRAPHLEPLRELVSKVRGSIHLVTESSIDSPVTSKLLLFDVFDSFLTNNPNIRIARKTFQVPGDVDFKFSVDQSLLFKDIQLVTFFTSTSGEIDSGQNYYLRSSVEKLTTKSPEYKASNHNFQVPLESREAGDWTLHYSSPRNDTLTGVAYATLSGHRTPITVKCYMTDYMANVSVPQDGSPPTLFVSVSQDLNQLVQNARVEVTLTDDLGNVIPYAVNIPMIDDGAGTPDITRGDGIYSLYLTQLSDPGFYGVHVTVRSDTITKLQHSLSMDDENADCCGSFVPELRSGNTPIHHLERYHDCGQIYLKDKYSADNFVGKMNDVKVESMDGDRKLTLSWSYPLGNFKYYELRMFHETSYDAIRTNWQRGDYITQNSFDPFNRNERMRHVFEMKHPSAGTYYFAIKVFGITTSKVSNIISVHFGPDRSHTNSHGKFLHFHTVHPRVICLCLYVHTGLSEWLAWEPFGLSELLHRENPCIFCYNKRSFAHHSCSVFSPFPFHVYLSSRPSFALQSQPNPCADGNDSSYVTSQDTGSSIVRGLEPWQIVAITGGAIILSVLLCFCILCVCLARKRRKTDDKEGGFFQGDWVREQPSSLITDHSYHDGICCQFVHGKD